MNIVHFDALTVYTTRKRTCNWVVVRNPALPNNDSGNPKAGDGVVYLYKPHHGGGVWDWSDTGRKYFGMPRDTTNSEKISIARTEDVGNGIFRAYLKADAGWCGNVLAMGHGVTRLNGVFSPDSQRIWCIDPTLGISTVPIWVSSGLTDAIVICHEMGHNIRWGLLHAKPYTAFDGQENVMSYRYNPSGTIFNFRPVFRTDPLYADNPWEYQMNMLHP
jgi:hypothetical protein